MIILVIRDIWKVRVGLPRTACPTEICVHLTQKFWGEGVILREERIKGHDTGTRPVGRGGMEELCSFSRYFAVTKYHRPGWLNKTKMCSLTVVKIKSLKSRC